MSESITNAADAVAALGALPMPVGPEPQASERNRLQAAFVAALDTAHKTQPCSCGSEIWSSCCHPGARRHSERRADAVLAVRDAEVEFLLGEADRLQLRVDEVERKYTFDTAELKRRIAELEAERHVTNEALSDAAEQLRADRDRITELEARDAALLTVMERVRGMDSSVTDADGHPMMPGCSVWGLLSDLATVRGLNRAPEHNQWSGEPYPPEMDDEAFEQGSVYAEFVLPPASGPSADESADKLTRLFAPTQSLREDEAVEAGER
jgi:hypothetical protein